MQQMINSISDRVLISDHIAKLNKRNILIFEILKKYNISKAERTYKNIEEFLQSDD